MNWKKFTGLVIALFGVIAGLFEVIGILDNGSSLNLMVLGLVVYIIFGDESE